MRGIDYLVSTQNGSKRHCLFPRWCLVAFSQSPSVGIIRTRSGTIPSGRSWIVTWLSRRTNQARDGEWSGEIDTCHAMPVETSRISVAKTCEWPKMQMKKGFPRGCTNYHHEYYHGYHTSDSVSQAPPFGQLKYRTRSLFDSYQTCYATPT